MKEEIEDKWNGGGRVKDRQVWMSRTATESRGGFESRRRNNI